MILLVSGLGLGNSRIAVREISTTKLGFNEILHPQGGRFTFSQPWTEGHGVATYAKCLAVAFRFHNDRSSACQLTDMRTTLSYFILVMALRIPSQWHTTTHVI